MQMWLASLAALSLVGPACIAGSATGAGAERSGLRADTTAVKSVTFRDTKAENPDAPDITTVVVSNTSAIWQFEGRPLSRPTRVVTFRVEVPNRPSLTDDMRVALWIDADSDPTTGLTGEVPLAGADYFVNWDLKLHQAASVVRCGPSTCSTTRVLRAAYAGGATFALLASDLGDTRRFRFTALVSSGIVYLPDGSLDFTDAAVDNAPDAGSWAYRLPERPRRLVAEAFTTAPAAPRAGAAFAVRLSARRDDTGALVASGRAGCTATIGSNSVPVLSRSFARGRATCVFDVPLGSERKVLRGSIAASAFGVTVNRVFSRTIR